MRDYMTPRIMRDYMTPRIMRDYMTPRIMRDYMTPRIMRDYMTPRIMRDYMTPRIMRDYMTTRIMRDYMTTRIMRDYMTTIDLTSRHYLCVGFVPCTHFAKLVGGQLFETKRVAVPDRLSTARSQGGGFFSGLLVVYTIRKIWQKMKR